jgi:hypothetical protein
MPRPPRGLYLIGDFPYLRGSETPAAKAIEAAQGDVDLLKADVLKISHHGSKHGVNLELVERIDRAEGDVDLEHGRRRTVQLSARGRTGPDP